MTRLPTVSVSGVKEAYASLIAWGKVDFRPEVNTSRYEVFEDLLEGLGHIEAKAADAAALSALDKARGLAIEAREFYRAGNFRGGILTIQESHEAFLDVRVRGRKGKPENVPLL